MNKSSVLIHSIANHLSELYGYDLTQSDCQDIARSLVQFSQVLLEIDNDLATKHGDKDGIKTENHNLSA